MWKSAGGIQSQADQTRGWETAGSQGLVTDWALRSTILVSAASQIIKRDGNL